MQKFEIVITNPDGSLYWQQGFETKKDLNLWLKEEQTRPYWKKDFVTEIRDNSAALKAQREQWEAAQKAEIDKQLAIRAELKALRKKGKLTLDDVKLALDKILDLLGVVPDPESPATPAPAAKS